SNHAHRLRELDLSLLEILHDEQVDRLLAVHVRVVIRAENVVYRLEFQRPFGETEEMRSVEADAILRLDRLTHQPGNLGHLLARRTVRYAEVEDDAALVHPLVVADAALQQVGVGENELLAGQTPNPGRLQPHLLHRAEHVIHDDEVTVDERFIQDDGEGGEKVSKNVLDGQRDGDAA